MKDLNDRLGQLAAVSARALIPSDEACALTGRSWNSVGEKDSIVVFQCGHAYLTSALMDASAGGGEETSSRRESFSADDFVVGGSSAENNALRCYMCSVSGGGGGGTESRSGTVSSIDDIGAERSKRGRTRRISNFFSWYAPLNQNPPSWRERNSENANCDNVGASGGGGGGGGGGSGGGGERSGGVGHLDAAQDDAVRLWKSTFRTPDRLGMLRRLESSGKCVADNPFDEFRSSMERTEQSIFRKNNFSLRLKPKPILPVD